MKNLLLISIDTLRADVAYSRKFPAINSLRDTGVTFLNSVSSSPLTPVSHATVLTGLQPYNHGIRHLFREQLPKGTTTLATILKGAGYDTGAIVSCPWMNKWYGFSQGFDTYDDEIPRLADWTDPLLTVDVKKRGTALKRANIVVDRAYNWITKTRDLNKPYFLFIHFFDAHWPYEAPEKFGWDNVYEEEVAFSDHHLGNFLQKIEKEGLTDDTTILLFSDHWEDLDGLYPNDKWWKELGHPEELGHGTLLYDQTQKTAFIIRDESLPQGIDFENQVRLVDITPTLLDLLGVKSEISFDGESVLPIVLNGSNKELLGYSETFYPEEQKEFKDITNKKSIRMNGGKTIFHLWTDEIETYNLIQDPNELANLLSKKLKHG